MLVIESVLTVPAQSYRICRPSPTVTRLCCIPVGYLEPSLGLLVERSAPRLCCVAERHNVD